MIEGPGGSRAEEATMGHLTDDEKQELAAFFNATGGIIGRGLRAQSYEPGGGEYDPFRDRTLATLVLEALHRANSPENFVWRVLSLLEERGGALHVEVLRALVGHGEFERPAIAKEFHQPELVARARVALERGRQHAERSEHRRALEVSYEAARARGCSGPTTAMRVLETDAYVTRHGVRLSPGQVYEGALDAVEEALKPRDEPFLFAIRREIHVMGEAAVAAYRDTRREVVAAKSETKAKRQRAKEDYLGELLAEKKRKDAARFERRLGRLRRAS